MKNKVYLGLGSNKGNKLDFIIQAINLINQNLKCSIIQYSSVYETLPYGIEKQANFLNAVVEIETSFSLKELHKFVKDAELLIGRKESFKWGPREIDIDILLFNSIVIETKKLIVPHKDLLNRDFELKPLHELKSDFVFPGTEKIISDKYLSGLRNHIIGVKRVELLN